MTYAGPRIWSGVPRFVLGFGTCEMAVYHMVTSCHLAECLNGIFGPCRLARRRGLTTSPVRRETGFSSVCEEDDGGRAHCDRHREAARANARPSCGRASSVAGPRGVGAIVGPRRRRTSSRSARVVLTHRLVVPSTTVPPRPTRRPVCARRPGGAPRASRTSSSCGRGTREP